MKCVLIYDMIYDIIVFWLYNFLKLNIDIEIIMKYLKVRIVDKKFFEKKILLVLKERYEWKIGLYKFYKKFNIFLIIVMWENLCFNIEYLFCILFNC